METSTKPEIIEKEDITALSFPKEPLSRTKDEKSILTMKLQKAQTLGNIHHNKIKILFKDDKGLKEVNTTVWAVGEDYVVLKKGVFIPINRIVDLQI
jgi:hypothetical protein